MECSDLQKIFALFLSKVFTTSTLTYLQVKEKLLKMVQTMKSNRIKKINPIFHNLLCSHCSSKKHMKNWLLLFEPGNHYTAQANLKLKSSSFHFLSIPPSMALGRSLSTFISVLKRSVIQSKMKPW